jgi:ATP-dependent Clp protease ATP-binding subunit ClpA
MLVAQPHRQRRVRDHRRAMFELFDERARMVVVLAREEAREMRHGDIAGEHLLLGIARVDPRLAGTHPDRIRGAVVERRGVGERAPPEEIPFTAEARGALESAGRAAGRDGDPVVRPSHILRALLELRGPAAEILAGLGVDPTAAIGTATAAHAAAGGATGGGGATRGGSATRGDSATRGGATGADPSARSLPPELVEAEAQVLLMLLRGGGPGAQLLRRHGVDEDTVRAELGYLPGEG